MWLAYNSGFSASAHVGLASGRWEVGPNLEAKGLRFLAEATDLRDVAQLHDLAAAAQR
ncbi:hypothetical protein BH20ACT22_BH20ACT22_22010 [soil metagenome]